MEDDRQRLPLPEAQIDENNNIHIADEVVAIVAGMAATEVPGVANMAGGIMGDLTDRLGLKNLQRGVKVEVGKQQTAIDLSIVVHYGARIHEVAKQVQEEVTKTVEDMTGINVIGVKVHVLGVSFDNHRQEQAEQA